MQSASQMYADQAKKFAAKVKEIKEILKKRACGKPIKGDGGGDYCEGIEDSAGAAAYSAISYKDAKEALSRAKAAANYAKGNKEAEDAVLAASNDNEEALLYNYMHEERKGNDLRQLLLTNKKILTDFNTNFELAKSDEITSRLPYVNWDGSKKKAIIKDLLINYFPLVDNFNTLFINLLETKGSYAGEAASNLVDDFCIANSDLLMDNYSPKGKDFVIDFLTTYMKIMYNQAAKPTIKIIIEDIKERKKLAETKKIMAAAKADTAAANDKAAVARFLDRESNIKKFFDEFSKEKISDFIKNQQIWNAKLVAYRNSPLQNFCNNFIVYFNKMNRALLITGVRGISDDTMNIWLKEGDDFLKTFPKIHSSNDTQYKEAHKYVDNLITEFWNKYKAILCIDTTGIQDNLYCKSSSLGGGNSSRKKGRKSRKISKSSKSSKRSHKKNRCKKSRKRNA